MSILKELWNLFTKDSKVNEEVETTKAPAKKEKKKPSRSFQGFQDMMLQETGPGESVRYDLGRYATIEVSWMSKDTDTEGRPLRTRIPSNMTNLFKVGQPFVAADRRYLRLEDLLAAECEEPNWYKDIYGRDVLYFGNRFPCFDSYDYLTENRYYRWMFIFGEHTLTRVYHTDEQKDIFVTEDVRYIELDWWKIIKEL